MDILDMCTFYKVDPIKLSVEQKKEYNKKYNCEISDDVDNLYISYSDIKQLFISDDAINWDSAQFIEDELEGILTDKIGKHPHYLVIACGCRWNGASGWMFTDSIVKTCERSYEISLDLQEEGVNAIKCRESSHDVPTGSRTFIIGLSDVEYKILKNKDLDKLLEVAESRF